MPEPLPTQDLVEADLWSQLPADLPELLARLSRADLSLQDEVQFAFHPTLTRVWCQKGQGVAGNASWKRRATTGIRLRLWAVDWRDGWFEGSIAAGRTVDVSCRASASDRRTLEPSWACGDAHCG